MRGHRLFGSFGFNLPRHLKEEPISRLSKSYESWEFNEHVHDWYDPISGRLLSEYTMPRELRNLLKNEVDSELE